MMNNSCVEKKLRVSRKFQHLNKYNTYIIVETCQHKSSQTLASI